MPKGTPFSIRLSEPTDTFVAAEARRTRRSKSSVVEELTEEAARMRRYPGIGFAEGPSGRRAIVVGTGLDVWELVDLIRGYGSIDRVVAEFPHVTEAHGRLVLAYCKEFGDEIDAEIEDNRRVGEQLDTLYPFVEHASKRP